MAQMAANSNGAPILGVRQELAELMPLDRLNEKESQRRYTVDHGAGVSLRSVSR